MISGLKILAIFGFCDIHQFNDVNKVLQEVTINKKKKIMQFMNEIAEITNGIVDSMKGAHNKNIGEAFLFPWKFPQQFVQQYK
jgi:hypothetical protein